MKKFVLILISLNFLVSVNSLAWFYPVGVVILKGINYAMTAKMVHDVVQELPKGIKADELLSKVVISGIEKRFGVSHVKAFLSVVKKTKSTKIRAIRIRRDGRVNRIKPDKKRSGVFKCCKSEVRFRYIKPSVSDCVPCTDIFSDCCDMKKIDGWNKIPKIDGSNYWVTKKSGDGSHITCLTSGTHLTFQLSNKQINKIKLDKSCKLSEDLKTWSKRNCKMSVNQHGVVTFKKLCVLSCEDGTTRNLDKLDKWLDDMEKKKLQRSKTMITKFNQDCKKQKEKDKTKKVKKFSRR